MNTYDILNYFSYILGHHNLPNDIGSKSEGPSQPKLLTFPINYTIAKKKTCRFNTEWYKRHPWISHSTSANKVFCFAFIHFLANQKEDRFTIKGFDNWAYAVGDKNKRLDKHGKCDSHLTAVKRWESYQSNPVSIEERLTPGRPTVVDENCAYFTKLIKYMRWFCLQEVAFRGVDEHDDASENRGNFCELIMDLEFELHSEFEEQ